MRQRRVLGSGTTVFHRISSLAHLRLMPFIAGAANPALHLQTGETEMNMTTDFGDRMWGVLRILGWLSVAAILITPAVLMRFTSEVKWTLSDFVFAGVLLVGGGAVIELFALRIRQPLARIAFALVVIAAVAMVWGRSI